MPITYQLYNLTDFAVTVDDMPVTVVVPAKNTASIPGGNTQSDILGSALIRDGVLESRLHLLVNNKMVDYEAILKSQGSA